MLFFLCFEAGRTGRDTALYRDTARSETLMWRMIGDFAPPGNGVSNIFKLKSPDRIMYDRISTDKVVESARPGRFGQSAGWIE